MFEYSDGFGIREYRFLTAAEFMMAQPDPVMAYFLEHSIPEYSFIFAPLRGEILRRIY